jgi:hypothetical protein
MVSLLTREQLIDEVEIRNRRLTWLKNLGRFTDGLQIIILATFGQYLYSGGAQQLTSEHWQAAKDFFGGYQNVGISLIAIATLGLVGLFSLAWTRTDNLYNVIMWVYSLAAATWFIGIGITHHLARSGSTGLWSLGLAGLFFVFTRLAITIAEPIHFEESKSA